MRAAIRRTNISGTRTEKCPLRRHTANTRPVEGNFKMKSYEI
jgi:hypothetical protein